MDNNKLVTWLFKTDAVRVCPENKPFWYTSSKIGPYYINTHFLYGSEEKANSLLKVIDVCKENKMECSEVILELAYKNFESDEIYRGLISSMCDYIKENIDLKNIDYISGGERRDWFFSLIIANLLKLPHITIFKDLSAVLYQNGISSEIKDLKNANVLHIADIITEASSYIRAWIPAITALNGNLKYSLVVIDRLQGGAEKLESAGVASHALMKVNEDLFDGALEEGHITATQHHMLMKYLDDPTETMRSFLKEHPEFLENSLKSDPKTAERAKICIEQNIYGL
ncbi:orotate phosphoribosyltransferase [Ruminiclostridium herbifermentans]|uniref:Orotate phosphoribosyltransferase n=1 Tax=Ruminiclostridium herbifermentans TaxID=2488810 RepID=A0A4V6EPD4_9FIRM|nr:orotate phosphoribosyltransferase [Ruminiclostridium herbifermentans]QNU68494.1 orotate phosphoribosyltransferase [Ruminiclostridium herbifermentans]